MYAGVPSTAPACGRARRLGRRRASRRQRRRRRSLERAELLREPPVDHDGLAERADEHVRRLEIAVDDALAVRVRERVGDGDDVRQEREPLLERRPRARDRRLERSPVDELHRVERLAVRPAPGLVDRDDRRVLQARGDQRLALEARGEPAVARCSARSSLIATGRPSRRSRAARIRPRPPRAISPPHLVDCAIDHGQRGPDLGSTFRPTIRPTIRIAWHSGARRRRRQRRARGKDRLGLPVGFVVGARRHRA